MISLCTYFDRAYISKGLALIQSLRTHHGDGFELFVLALDDETYRVVEHLPQVWATNLSFLENEYTPTASILKSVKPTRTLLEYYWSITPLFTEFSLAMSHTNAISYVDADVWVTHPLDSLYREVRNASIAITPHRFSQARAKTHGVNGTYNVGWVYFKNDETARACLDEWANLCAAWCFQRSEQDEAGNWRFGDQGFFNTLVPKYGIHAVQNIGIGTAPWNAENYEYEVGAGARMNESKRLFVIERNADGGVKRIDTLAMFHVHSHEYDPRRRTFKRGGYALPPPIVEHIYLPYEAELLRITKATK